MNVILDKNTGHYSLTVDGLKLLEAGDIVKLFINGKWHSPADKTMHLKALTE